MAKVLSSLTVYERGPEKLNMLARLSFNGAPTFPDSEGAVWIAAKDGVARQTWSDGVPRRRELIPFADSTRWLGQIVIGPNDKFAVWRTRWAGMLRSTSEAAQPFLTETGYPVSVLAPAPSGGVWVGYHMYGLSLIDWNGQQTRWTRKEGLPNETILDVSPVPGSNLPTAWVATNSGAALVSSGGVKKTVEPADTPGPVDAVVSLPNGGAYLAFNPIAPELFLSADASRKSLRRTTMLRHVTADGVAGEPMALARGEILDMVLGVDEETVWIGTTAGLYRLHAGRLERVTASGRLQPAPVRRLAMAPDGTVWMGIDRKGDDAPASVLGYDPGLDDISGFSVEEGLPTADGIDMVGLLPDGRLALMAAGILLRSAAPVFVPSRFSLLWTVIGFVVALIFIAGLAWGLMPSPLKVAQFG